MGLERQRSRGPIILGLTATTFGGLLKAGMSFNKKYQSC
jgi:hypothetical protein